MRYVFAALLVLCLGFLLLGVGRYEITYSQILDVFLSLAGFATIQERISYIILEVRLPRVILAIFAGATLGISGASFQSIFKNPLATPDILGVASGAAFGAALALTLGLNLYLLTLSAFIFGVLTLLFVLIIARDSSNRIMIILGGIIISALFSSLISLLKYLADPQDTLPTITYWLLGSLAVSDIKQLVFCALGMALGGGTILLYAWKHNLLMLEDLEAKSLGLNITHLRILLIFASTLIVSCVVSICGIIGWVGLIIPHIARIIYGSNTAAVIPASLFIGAVFMLLIDTLSRTLTAEEIPISILSSIIGALFFIVILYRFKGVMKL